MGCFLFQFCDDEGKFEIQNEVPRKPLQVRRTLKILEL